MKPVRLLVDAEAEIDSALAWYRQEVPHRTAVFADALDKALKAIGSAPETCPSVDLPAGAPDVRRAPVRGFPWGVFFLDLATEVIVIAVAHARREPGYWLDRLPPPR